MFILLLHAVPASTTLCRLWLIIELCVYCLFYPCNCNCRYNCQFRRDGDSFCLSFPIKPNVKFMPKLQSAWNLFFESFNRIEMFATGAQKTVNSQMKIAGKQLRVIKFSSRLLTIWFADAHYLFFVASSKALKKDCFKWGYGILLPASLNLYLFYQVLQFSALCWEKKNKMEYVSCAKSFKVAFTIIKTCLRKYIVSQLIKRHLYLIHIYMYI